MSALRRKYHREVKKLEKMATDFTPGADARFIEQRRKCSQLLDQLIRRQAQEIDQAQAKKGNAQ